jgi:hypothetical protein
MPHEENRLAITLPNLQLPKNVSLEFDWMLFSNRGTVEDNCSTKKAVTSFDVTAM